MAIQPTNRSPQRDPDEYPWSNDPAPSAYRPPRRAVPAPTSLFGILKWTAVGCGAMFCWTALTGIGFGAVIWGVVGCYCIGLARVFQEEDRRRERH